LGRLSDRKVPERETAATTTAPPGRPTQPTRRDGAADAASSALVTNRHAFAADILLNADAAIPAVENEQVSEHVAAHMFGRLVGQCVQRSSYVSRVIAFRRSRSRYVASSVCICFFISIAIRWPCPAIAPRLCRMIPQSGPVALMFVYKNVRYANILPSASGSLRDF